MAVLVNEFGDIDIDSQLLVSVEENMVGLSNGCICCTINDSLVDTVYTVLERQERIDYLVVETTGVADPLPIMLTFLSRALEPFTRLDSVINSGGCHYIRRRSLRQSGCSEPAYLWRRDSAQQSGFSHRAAALLY